MENLAGYVQWDRGGGRDAGGQMRNMSFALTTEQVRKKQKTLTSRFGWWFLKPGNLVWPVEKTMGLKKGEHVKRIGYQIRVIATWSTPFNIITPEEVAKEGFPGMSPEMFVAKISSALGFQPDRVCNRIEFEYVEEQ